MHTFTCIGVRALQEDCECLHDKPGKLFLLFSHIVFGITWPQWGDQSLKLELVSALLLLTKTKM